MVSISSNHAKEDTLRIATRLWIALLVTILLVLGFGVFTRVREEQRLLLDVTLRDRRFFAVVLQSVLTREEQRDQPLIKARELLARPEIAEAHISTRLVALDGEQLPAPRLPASELQKLQHHEIVVRVYGGELLTYVPLASRHVALELVEPHAIDTLLASVGWRSLWTQALALATLAGVVTLVLTRWLVGRPLARLTLLARQIGAGDFTGRASEATGKHEVGILAREMNGMAERLDHARRALDELGAERVEALEQLRHADRLRTVGQLASALAHELGTPLNVVSGHARLIEREPEALDEVRSGARTILEQTGRMTRILKDLLSFARSRHGSRVEQVDLGQLAEQAKHMLEPLTKRYGATITIDAPAVDVSAPADPHQLLQVLTNLLTNAMQSMPQGGLIRVAVDELEAEPPTGVHASKGRYARIGVSDQGGGIAADDLPHLFEPFFTRKVDGEGTGLGLAVVQGIAREHRGWVSVQSELGRGSRFDVYLPRIAPEQHSGEVR
jgi:two-component system, NtrC family, sensor kinase